MDRLTKDVGLSLKRKVRRNFVVATYFDPLLLSSLIGFFLHCLKVIRVGQRTAAVQISQTFFWSTLLYSISIFIYDEAHILFDLWQKCQALKKKGGDDFAMLTWCRQALIKTGSV